jgi:hypothetical protein
MAQNARTSQAELAQEFTSFRETFREELSQINPEYFQRYGAVLASVCHVLSRVFGDSIDSQPHLDQSLVCDWCGISTHCRCRFTLLGSSDLLEEYLNEDDGPFLPLQTAVTPYVQRFSQEPYRDRCSACSGPLNVESLSVPQMPWLWIELEGAVSPVTPSYRLVFGLQHQRRAYTLQAVIYFGGSHFTVRALDQSSKWWKYDGMWRFGAPRIDDVEDEADLLECDGRRAAYLLYRQEEVPD